MDGSRFPVRQHLPALLLGLGAAIATLLPPLDVGLRLDRGLIDTWSRAAPLAAPEDLILVELEDSAWMTELVTLTERDVTKAVLTTFAQPPSPHVNAQVLGPMELPLNDQLLRRTEWHHGGHLWFRPEQDGRVRHDWTVIDADTPIPSLAATAVGKLKPAGAAELDDKHWIRFYEPSSFQRATPEELLAKPALLHDRIVIAGSVAPQYETPLGPMAAAELVAQTVAGRLAGTALKSSPWFAIVGYALAAVLVLAALRARGRSRRFRLGVVGIGSAGLVGLNAAAFFGFSVALPVAGPLALLLVAGGLSAAHPGAREELEDAYDPTPFEARRLLAAGDLIEAWSVYRGLPPSMALLAELYELGNALDAAGHAEHAADVFHRIAQTDIRYRDVAKRLAVISQSQSRTHPAQAALVSNLPTMLDRYELLEIVGQGATGQVYLGRDPKINRILAIKVIHLGTERGDHDSESSEQFKREIESAGRLSHPNIVTIYDVGETGRLAYIAMEYLKGRHLSEFTDADRLLPVPKLLDLLARTADALHYAHEQNVVHRDIKPANIMYDSVSDGLKITDFGIARLIDVNRTRTGIILGTPSFMAPEQLEGENVNGHTDLFALGVSLYQLLTGRLPFRGASMTKLMFVIANEPHHPVTALRPDLPNALNLILDKALAKRPSDRFSTGAEMANALRAVAAELV